MNASPDASNPTVSETAHFPIANGTCTVDHYRITVQSLPVRPGSFSNWIANPQYQQWMTGAILLGIVALAGEVTAVIGLERTELFRVGLIVPLAIFVMVDRSYSIPQVSRTSINRVDLQPPKEPYLRGRVIIQFRETGYTKRSSLVAPRGQRAYERMVKELRRAGVVESDA